MFHRCYSNAETRSGQCLFGIWSKKIQYNKTTNLTHQSDVTVDVHLLEDLTLE